MMEVTERSHSHYNAVASGYSIVDMVYRLGHAIECTEDWDDREDCTAADADILDALDIYDERKTTEDEWTQYHDEEEARERIEERPLSVRVRSGWFSPGEDAEAEEFEILLTTGGPACRIMGELDEYHQPRRAWIEHQDWGTPWTQLINDAPSQETLVNYSSVFYFGE